ncbi:MAG TPA: hypothetical protein VH105_24555 [Burkholderiales bacterium]|jgi:hypothetical protein|nr:hypothetical protein [Burkholderiales bacterium]
MSLFSPWFRPIDQEIATLERRIELRRSLIRVREHELQQQLVDTLTSPVAYAGAAALGYVLGRGNPAGRTPAARRSGLMARVAGVAVALLQLRYGSPYQWVARLVAGVAAKGRRNDGGGR